MMLLFWTFACLTLFGIIGYLFQMAAVRSYVFPPDSGESAGFPRSYPPVSILKPLKGLDDGLFDNLESFCNLDYPRYEIIFALQNRNDPAHKVVQKIREKYPSCDISIVVEFCDAGLNPKVNNLIPAYKRARHDLILISDSNVRVEKDYLKDTVRHMADPSVGLVSNIIRGVRGRSLGAVFENLHLNSFVVGNVCLLDRYLGMPCVVGKSMLMRKDDLESIGGLYTVKDLLAEDYIMGERIHALGKRVVLSGHVINNVNEDWGIGKFLGRHIRWGKLRWKIGGAKYFFELVSNTIVVACLPLIFSPVTTGALLLAGSTGVMKIARDFYLGRKIGADMKPFLYLLAPAKDLFIGIIWIFPILSNTVTWRGNRYQIGKNSMLYPCPETGLKVWKPRIMTVIKTRLALSKF